MKRERHDDTGAAAPSSVSMVWSTSTRSAALANLSWKVLVSLTSSVAFWMSLMTFSISSNWAVVAATSS